MECAPAPLTTPPCLQLAPLAAMTWLTHLDLTGCWLLRELPPAVVALPALRHLMLTRCSLEALPEGPYLGCLERLNVSENR